MGKITLLQSCELMTNCGKGTLSLKAEYSSVKLKSCKWKSVIIATKWRSIDTKDLRKVWSGRFLKIRKIRKQLGQVRDLTIKTVAENKDSANQKNLRQYLRENLCSKNQRRGQKGIQFSHKSKEKTLDWKTRS